MHFSTVFTGTKFRSRSALLPSTSPAGRLPCVWWSPQLNMRPAGARYVSESRVLDWNSHSQPRFTHQRRVRIHAPTTARAPAGFARLALTHTYTWKSSSPHADRQLDWPDYSPETCLRALAGFFLLFPFPAQKFVSTEKFVRTRHVCLWLCAGTYWPRTSTTVRPRINIHLVRLAVKALLNG
jgi:hypothetical protein